MVICTYNRKSVASIRIWSAWTVLVSFQEPYNHLKIYLLIYLSVIYIYNLRENMLFGVQEYEVKLHCIVYKGHAHAYNGKLYCIMHKDPTYAPIYKVKISK